MAIKREQVKPGKQTREQILEQFKDNYEGKIEEAKDRLMMGSAKDFGSALKRTTRLINNQFIKAAQQHKNMLAEGQEIIDQLLKAYYMKEALLEKHRESMEEFCKEHNL